MSVAFTIDETNWHEKAEELRRAFSERCRAWDVQPYYRAWEFVVTDEETGEGSWQWVTQTETDEDVPLAGGESLQAFNFWREQQYRIQQMASVWVDEGTGEVTNLAADYEAFCEIVGGDMYTSPSDYGWPRSNSKDEDGNLIMQRGLHQKGDYIGPWLINSLKGAYEKTAYHYTGVLSKEDAYAQQGQQSYFGSVDTPAEAYPSALSRYLSDTPYSAGRLGNEIGKHVISTASGIGVSITGYHFPGTFAVSADEFMIGWFPYDRNLDWGVGWADWEIGAYSTTIPYLFTADSTPEGPGVPPAVIHDLKQYWGIGKYDFTNGAAAAA